MQLGGMALRDGVLLQSDGYWAAAVREEDGGVKVVSGAKPQLPARETLRQVPVLRGLVRLGEAMAVLPAVRRRTGRPVLPQEDPRMLAATAASAVATVALRASRRGSPVVRELAVAGVGLAPVLLALRDSRLSRYHGAEHKSVAAYESGWRRRRRAQGTRPLRLQPDRADGRHQPRRRTWCCAPPARSGSRWRRSSAGLVSIGTAMELFSWMSRHQDHPLARTLRQARHRDAAPVHDQRADGGPAGRGATWRCKELLRLEGRRRPPEPRSAGSRPGRAPAASRRLRQSAGSRSARRLRRRSCAFAYHSFCWSVCGTSGAPGSACRCR